MVIAVEEWRPWYEHIAGLLKLDRSRDEQAAELLSRMLKDRGLGPKDVEAIVKGRVAVIFGAGPSLREDVLKLAENRLLNRCVLVAADGATSALLNLVDTTPHLIITDLDGRLNDLLRASRRGAIMVVHAHGDNLRRVERVVPKLKMVLGTTQTEPKPHVYNFGGFTDGDRAVFLALAMGARSIGLVGMDLGVEIGEYSKPKYSYERKVLKLKICRELLEWLATKTTTPLYNLTSHGEQIRGYRSIEPKEFLRLIEGKV